MENSIYANLVNQYPVSKTLRFELIPQGKTLEYIEKRGLITKDEERAEQYKEIKKMIDDYHRAFIDEVLKDVKLTGLNEYYELYISRDRSQDQLDKCADALRKQIADALKGKNNDSIKEKFDRMFKEPLIKEDLVNFVGRDEKKIAIIRSFNRFTTYFYGFHENRKNMYTDEAQSTAIAYRVINQNLPKYIDNYIILEKAMREESIYKAFETMRVELQDVLGGDRVEDALSIDNYCAYLSQEGIDRYNTIIGGKTIDSNTKIKGVNEYINLRHDQTAESNERIGSLKPLYKQILSDRKTFSFVGEAFEHGAKGSRSVLNAIREFSDAIENSLDELSEMLEELPKYDLTNIYIANDGSIEEISKEVYGNWGNIRSLIQDRYDLGKGEKQKKNYEKYSEKREKELAKIKSYPIAELQDLTGEDKIEKYFSENKLSEMIQEIKDAFAEIQEFLAEEYPESKNLAQDKERVQQIKRYLDAVKAFQKFVKPLMGSGVEPNKDAAFYGGFVPAFEMLDSITPLYNKVRNYMTQKPYSVEKFKLNFENSTLLNGWDLNKERDNSGILLRSENNYYLGIMSDNIRFCEPENEKSTWEKMEYKLLPGPNKMLPKVFFSESRIGEFNPSSELIEKYKRGTHKKGDQFNLQDCHDLIDFYKESITKHEDWSKFGFIFSETKSYRDISEFYREVSEQGYKVSFRTISEKQIHQYVDEGKLYLFKIYNKDFSPRSKGTPNLHTLYWKMLFDESNLRDVVYKLNGEAEVFYRRASIDKDKAIIHKANEPIQRKNENHAGESSLFPYDLIKDKRYTMDKFQFHVPITMNFKANGNDNVNDIVQKAIKKKEQNYVIGIDRGERNLLYLCLINSAGKIVKQTTLNSVGETDYHHLLDKRETDRDRERKSWTNIESIKELKEGYLSQAIYQITRWMVDYDAIVVLEDLNYGFMRGRQKIEKQVYQKFEHMLIDKLNYLVDKKADINQNGGLLKAYQLTKKFESFQKLGKQSGVLFYTQAWNTSKIDPTTGFVNLFDTRYESMEKAKDFWKRFDSIQYCSDEKMLCFSFRYSSFTQKAEGTKDEWTIWTNGDRLVNERNESGAWTCKKVNLTEAFIRLFEQYGVNYSNKELKQIVCNVQIPEFYKELVKLFKLVLQMRNSETGSEIDYLLSPVKNSQGLFYDSRKCGDNLPKDADANGAYNIARKGLMIIEIIKSTPDEDLPCKQLAIKNKDWLAFAQRVDG